MSQRTSLQIMHREVHLEAYAVSWTILIALQVSICKWSLTFSKKQFSLF